MRIYKRFIVSKTGSSSVDKSFRFDVDVISPSIISIGCEDGRKAL
jgi:hypothetical protein